MKGTILILALTPSTPIPAPVSPVVTFLGMERATIHLAPRMPIGYMQCVVLIGAIKGRRYLMTLKQFIYGLSTFATGPRKSKYTAYGTQSARYCYSVWLRHLTAASDIGASFPRVVAELGPGDSLGIGIAALLSGCDKYYGLDVVEYANTEGNLRVFDELVSLFRNREPIPNGGGYVKLKPQLESYDFPAHLLASLDTAIQPERLERIRESILRANTDGSMIQYKAPWGDSAVVLPGTVDMIYSQAVLEYVDDLAGTYRSMHSWLKPGGIMSHSIDFSAHEFSDHWNGHWECPALAWWMLRGRRPYFLNRQPHSAHTGTMKATGFSVVRDDVIIRNAPICKPARRFMGLSPEDLSTAGAFVQARKT